MKKALVTGGAGFVGRHMVAELLTRGYDVTSVDLKPMKLTYRTTTGPGHLQIIQDVNDVVRRNRPPMLPQFDLVVHCAYHVGGRAAIDGVNLNFMRNVELDAAMFAWAIQTKQKQFLYFSSSAVYPRLLQDEWHEGHRLVEDDRYFTDTDNSVVDHPWEPDALYGWAKFLGEKMAMNAREQGVKVSVVRPFSGYGEDQDLNYPFPSFVQRAKNRENPFTIWGSVDQTRDWIHIDDVVKGALAVVDSETAEPVNLCTGRATSMYDLVTRMATHVGYVPSIIGDDSKPQGVMHRVGDPSLFYTIYTPSVTIEEGVGRALREV